jgi:hypothetical protein
LACDGAVWSDAHRLAPVNLLSRGAGDVEAFDIADYFAALSRDNTAVGRRFQEVTGIKDKTADYFRNKLSLDATKIAELTTASNTAQGKVRAATVNGQPASGASVASAEEPATFAATEELRLGQAIQEIVMLPMLVTALPPDVSSVLVSAAETRPTTVQPKMFTSCQDAQSLTGDAAQNAFSPLMPEVTRALGFRRTNLPASELARFKIALSEPPKHGEVRLLAAQYSWMIIPKEGYKGPDRAVFLVERNRKQVRVVFNFLVMEVMPGDVQHYSCRSFKFSAGDQLLDFHALASENDATADLQAWLRRAQLSALLSVASATVTGLTDLPAMALGQTTGTGSSAQITLDAAAAGHGWFIDATPEANDEYLPTADPNVWKARPGSEAEGKMDLLSVLLHEYGHALGLAHSHDAHAAMAATLTPGTRRLPTADELALMSRLVAELNLAQAESGPEHDHDHSGHDHEHPMLPNGQRTASIRLGRRVNSLDNNNDGADRQPQYAAAVNTTLTNASKKTRQPCEAAQWSMALKK